MAGGRKKARRIQLGRQSAVDTEVNATYKYPGTGTILDDIVVAQIDQDVGIASGTTEVNIPMKGGILALGPDVASFEQILHILEMSIKTATPAIDGTGNDPYIYTYAFPTTSANTVKQYTVEAGDDVQEEQFLNAFCQDWTLSGSGRNPYQLSANLRGGTVSPGTYTTDPGLSARNNMNFGMTKIYIDDVTETGGPGTTIKSNTVRGVNFKYTSSIKAKDTADGRLDFSFVQDTMDYVATAEVEFEHDSIAVAEIAKYRAGTPRLLQIKIEGSTAFANVGTTYSVPTMLINLPGIWMNFGKIGENNGNDIVSGTFESHYDSTYGGAGAVIVAVGLSAVP